MTEMTKFSEMTIEQRERCKFIPLGEHIYNGLGYMLGPISSGWNNDSLAEFEHWRRQHRVKRDHFVYEFPDRETVVMAMLMFE